MSVVLPDGLLNCVADTAAGAWAKARAGNTARQAARISFFMAGSLTKDGVIVDRTIGATARNGEASSRGGGCDEWLGHRAASRLQAEDHNGAGIEGGISHRGSASGTRERPAAHG